MVRYILPYIATSGNQKQKGPRQPVLGNNEKKDKIYVHFLFYY